MIRSADAEKYKTFDNLDVLRLLLNLVPFKNSM